MASSQASSQKKSDHIIDGRLFSRSTVMDTIKSETEDLDSMEIIISRIEKQGLYRFGCKLSEFYDEHLVEEFYSDASVKLLSRNQGGGVNDISAKVQGVRLCIDQSLLKTLFDLPSEGLTMEELESFGSKELLTAYWGLFTGYSSNTEKIGPAFESYTNLRFRMMVVILYREKVNWFQIVLKRLGEEVVKPFSQKKSFGLLLNNIIFKSGIPLSRKAKKIDPGKFIGSCKPTAFNQRSMSDSMSKLSKKKKQKKASSSKDKETVSAPTTVESLSSEHPEDPILQDAAPAEGTNVSIPVNPEPTTNMTDHHIFAGLENLDELTAHIESLVTSPIRIPIPVQDPFHDKLPSPVRDPSHNMAPTPVKNSSPKQAPIPVEDSISTENQIPVRSPSRVAPTFNELVEQVFQRFIKWKSFRTAPYDILNTGGSHPAVQNVDIPVSTFDPNQNDVSRAIQHKESVPMQNQADAERQQVVEPPVTLSTEIPEAHPVIPSSTATPSSSRNPQLKQLETISHQTIFLTDAVNALYKVSKEMDWLNLAATEEMSSVKRELTKIAQAFSVLPQDMKKAISNLQQIQEQSLLEEQSKIRISESKTIAALEYNESRISGHDRKIEDMTNFINSLAKKLSRFEEQQENVLKLLHNIDHTVSEINARKGEDDQEDDQDDQDASRDPALRRSSQTSRHEHHSYRK
ncbi:hypothetical protein OROMI_002001 [Orobanche minor]